MRVTASGARDWRLEARAVPAGGGMLFYVSNHAAEPLAAAVALPEGLARVIDLRSPWRKIDASAIELGAGRTGIFLAPEEHRRKPMKPGKRLVLASSSPRRRALLAEAGYHFDVFAADVDESLTAGLTPEAAAVEVARRKAVAVAANVNNAVILAADTIVVTASRRRRRQARRRGGRAADAART